MMLAGSRSGRIHAAADAQQEGDSHVHDAANGRYKLVYSDVSLLILPYGYSISSNHLNLAMASLTSSMTFDPGPTFGKSALTW